MEDQKQLLESIRDIMAGKPMTTNNTAIDDDILDLTQVVNADGSISQIQPKPVFAVVEPSFEPKAPEPQFTPKPELVVDNEPKDVLSEIDALLAESAPAAIFEEPAPEPVAIAPEPEPLAVEPAELELIEPTPVIVPEPVIINPEPVPEPVAIAPEPTPEPTPEPVLTIETKEERPMNDTANLLSGDAANAAKSSISSMLEKLQKPKDTTITPFRSGETVENLVMEMMKPMLKEWLDTNLPPMVQSIVEREIKKILPTA